MFDIDKCTTWFITNASKKITDSFNKRLLKEGITRVQWIALSYLEKFRSTSQYELGKKMNIKVSRAARLIDRMEREGLEYIKNIYTVNPKIFFTTSISLYSTFIPFIS